MPCSVTGDARKGLAEAYPVRMFQSWRTPDALATSTLFRYVSGCSSAVARKAAPSSSVVYTAANQAVL
jgi:hypothetical protein